MVVMQLPYGKYGLELNLDVPSLEILASGASGIPRDKDEDAIVQEAMASPISSKTLCELAKGKHSATIIISDHTRPVPSKHIIPFMLKELREGSPGIAVTLLVATGFHRVTTREELVAKLGEDIVRDERILVHDCQADETHAEIGVLPSGARLVVNRAAVETDLLVSEGFIEPHFFAGFSGGRKSVLPGICSRTTVLGNHCAKFIDSPSARTGVLHGNPLHADMEEACRLAKLVYIVNVIIDSEKRVVAAFAGDPHAAHRFGCDTLQKYCRVRPERKGDIVISTNGGAPLDQNVYQAVKGLTAAEAAAGEGATLIMCAECADGTGGDDFYRSIRDCESPQALLASIRKIPMDRTKPDQWEYQILARVLCKHKVIFVSHPAMQKTLEEMKLGYAPSLEAALSLAWQRHGRECRHIVIPDGVSVMVEEPA